MSRSLTIAVFLMIIAVFAVAGCGSPDVTDTATAAPVATTLVAQATTTTTEAVATTTTVAPATSTTLAATTATTKKHTTTTTKKVAKTTTTSVQTLVDRFIVAENWERAFLSGTVRGDFKITFINDGSYTDEADYAFAHIRLGNSPEIWTFQIGHRLDGQDVGTIEWTGDELNGLFSKYPSSQFEDLVSRISGSHLVVELNSVAVATSSTQ